MAEQIQYVMRMLKLDSLDSNQSLNFVKQKTGLRPSQVAFAIIVFLLIVLFISQASTLIVCFGCYLIPAYFSFLSLEDKNPNKDAKYLTYWVLFTITEIIAYPLRWALGPTIYSLTRIGVTCVLLHPEIQMSQKLYFQFVEPFISRYQNKIDDKFQRIAQNTKQQFMAQNKKNI